MASLAMYATKRGRSFDFIRKLVGVAALVVLADWLFFMQRLGSTLGLFGLALVGLLLLVRPPIRRSAALAAIGAAMVYTAALADDPSTLAALLFWTALSLAALLPRSRFDDGWRWAKRLLLHWLTLPFGLVEDRGGCAPPAAASAHSGSAVRCRSSGCHCSVLSSSSPSSPPPIR